jgi:adenosylcobinamide kinase / adenosylcobinamide-phosphate guanylyltransferase
MNSEIVLITGGVKSGKSTYALSYGREKGRDRAFVATAMDFDDEMHLKIMNHQKERGDIWKTFEEPKDIAGLVTKISGVFNIVLVDCMTLWVSNLLTVYNMTREDIESEFSNLVTSIQQSSASIVIVTNEVGLGIIPVDRITRSYQNLLGNLNREIAKIATDVFFMVAGMPLKMK